MVTIHVPLDPIPDPIGRVVGRKSLETFSSLKGALDGERSFDLTQDSSANWSAETCEALLKFSERPDFESLKIQMSPDVTWGPIPGFSRDQIEVGIRGTAYQAILTSAAAK
jgi:hypothetical protein